MDNTIQATGEGAVHAVFAKAEAKLEIPREQHAKPMNNALKTAKGMSITFVFPDEFVGMAEMFDEAGAKLTDALGFKPSDNARESMQSAIEVIVSTYAAVFHICCSTLSPKALFKFNKSLHKMFAESLAEGMLDAIDDASAINDLLKEIKKAKGA